MKKEAGEKREREKETDEETLSNFFLLRKNLAYYKWRRKPSAVGGSAGG